MDSLRAIDLFAGVGGVRIGFEAAGFDIAYSNDIDQKAAETYRLNFGEIDVANLFDVIKEPGMKRVPKRFDILLGGFPCQPFSIAGHKRGFADKGRGDLLFAVIEILKARKPRAIFLENVKHLINHDHGETFKRVSEELHNAGYTIEAKVLNSMHFGNVPQTRERVYIVGFSNPKTMLKFRWPEPIPLTKTMNGVLEKKVDEKYYYGPEDKYIFPKLKAIAKRKDKVYQYRRVYVRENKSGVCPTLTASMGVGGHNVPIVRDANGIRKLTPRECARLQGFPDSFVFPDNQAACYHYKQVGNSVTIPVIARIAESIRIALES